MSTFKQSFVVSGLNLNVYSHAEVIDPSLPVVAFFLLHGRFGSTKDLEPIVDSLFKSSYGGYPTGARRRDLIVITFDQRNHGSRLVEQKSNLAWDAMDPEKNNDQHAIDMYSIQAGTASDVIFMLDFLPSYIYPSAERNIEEWGIGGISLGGHATWIALSREPRLKYGVPIIGCPDYLALISQRAAKSSIPIGPPYIPESFESFLKQYDPVSTPFYVADASNPFLGKKVLVLSGAKDTLVPWFTSSNFVTRLEVGKEGSKEVFLQENAGHECTPIMVAEMSRFIWDKCLSA